MISGINFPDGEMQERNLAVIATCNGRYYGGGSTPIPQARMNDGVLETILVDTIGRLTFARLFADYSAGNHEKLSSYVQVVAPKVLEIHSAQEDIVACLDGETFCTNYVKVQLSDKHVNFFGPLGCDPNATAKPWSCQEETADTAEEYAGVR